MNYADRAKELFLSGLNCSQSVFVAFSPLTGLDAQTAKKVSIGLGGGVGRMREVCGAVSGAAMVLGMLCGGENADDKASAYKTIQQFCAEFKNENGYIVCRQLLGLDESVKETAVPEARTPQYYKKRPCAELVYRAAQILEQMIDKQISV